jgi:DNA repair protein RadC
MDFKVSDLPIQDRPLNRMVALGGRHLNNYELLALMIGTDNSLILAQSILAKFKTLEELSEATIEQLTQLKGIGKAVASRILSSITFAKKLSMMPDVKAMERKKYNSVTSPDILVGILRDRITTQYKEHFYVVSLDTRNNFIGLDEISVGTLTASLVHPREAFEAAIKRHAAHIIVAHNHPSGDIEPSEDDLKITRRLVDAGKTMGIDVLDHIIFTTHTYLSFKEKYLI